MTFLTYGKPVPLVQQVPDYKMKQSQWPPVSLNLFLAFHGMETTGQFLIEEPKCTAGMRMCLFPNAFRWHQSSFVLFLEAHSNLPLLGGEGRAGWIVRLFHKNVSLVRQT